MTKPAHEQPLEAALRWVANGFPIFPCLNLPGSDGHKRPLTPHSFKDATTDPEQIRRWWGKHPDALIGLPTGAVTGIAVLDLDKKNGKDGFAAVRDWEALSPVIAFTGSGGAHLYFQANGHVRSTTGKDGKDVRGEGGYVIVPPSAGYSWHREGDLSVLPPFPDAHRPPEYDPISADELEAEDPAEVAAALRVIPNDDVDYDSWVRIGMAVFAATGGDDDGLEAWHEWSAKSAKCDPRHTNDRWDRFRRSPPTSIGAGTLFYEASEADPFWRDNYRRTADAAAARELEAGEAQFVTEMGFLPQPAEPEPRTTESVATAPAAHAAEPGAAAEQRAPEPAAPEPTTSALGEWNAGAVDLSRIPPRRWLLGNTLCRSFLTCLFAGGGTGKTALAMTQALALATGRPLTGEHIFQRARVLYGSFEDDREELERRLLAAARHHDIAPEQIDGWLWLAAPEGKADKLVKVDRLGRVTVGGLKAALSQAITANNIDAVILDPLVKVHEVEENDNSGMDRVTQVLTNLAVEHDIAVAVLHHVSKGGPDPGNADRGRGASAVKDGARLVYTLTPMSSDEAGRIGVEEAERRSLIRVDSGKVNIAPPLDQARWFKIVGVALGNADAEGIYKGDNVQAVEPWTPPDRWKDIDNAMLRRIVDDINAGVPADPDTGTVAGHRYSAGSNATTRAAWKVVERHTPGKPEKQCRGVIKDLLKQKLIVEREYEDPVRRESVLGLFKTAQEDTDNEPM